MVESTVIITGFLLKLLGALIAFVISRIALANLDKAVGFDFKEWIKNASDQAVGIYLGARIIAICLLFALIIL